MVTGKKEISITNQPESIFQIDSMVNLKSILELSAYESVGKKGDKKEGARSVTCVEVRRSEQLDRKLCFDQTQGVLVSVSWSASNTSLIPINIHPKSAASSILILPPWEHNYFPARYELLAAERRSLRLQF